MKRYIFTLCSVAIIVGCGSPAPSLVTDDEEETSVGTAHINAEENVVLPWTKMISDSDVESLIVESDRLVYPIGMNPEIAVGDVLVSTHVDAPFLRKVLSISESDRGTEIGTRPALITEAVYKGTLSDKMLESSDDSTNFVQQKQAMRGQIAEKKDFGKRKVDANSVVEDTTQVGPVKFTMSPSLDIDSSFYFDLKIEPNSNPSAKKFSGTQTCSTRKDCFPNAARGADRSVSCEENKCVFKDVETSCNDIIGALDFAEKTPGCRALFEQYYEGRRSLDQFNNTACDETNFYILPSGDLIHLPPHPTQVDWAKDNCKGVLQRLVVDAEGSVEPTTGPIGVEIGAQASGDRDLWKGEERLTTKVFFIGWLPILFTVNGSFRINASYDAQITGVSLALDPIRVEDLKYGAGFNYYAGPAAEDDKGVMVGEKFQTFSQGEYGKTKANPVREPNPDIKGLTISQQNLTLQTGGNLTFKITAAGRIDVLIYDVAGPFIEPFSPYGELQFDAGAKLDVRDGPSATGDRCGVQDYNLCARGGVEGKIGITAENLCGKECKWEAPLYNTCSDFCPENEEALCRKWCLIGDEPTDPAFKEVEIVLSWNDERVDLDLELRAPTVVDYSDTDPGEFGYQHGSDTCPAFFASCNDVRESGRWVERIFVEEGGVGPDSATLHTIAVSNFKTMGGGGTFDLRIEKDGQVLQRWNDESVGAQGETKTFDFTIQ